MSDPNSSDSSQNSGFSNNLMSRLGAWFGLGTWWMTAVFWGVTLVTAAVFLVNSYPPMIDYPQHVAMGSILHELFIPGSAAHQLYETNLLTYNAGIELGVALLSFIMSAEMAGKLLIASYVVMFAVAALSLLDYAERPRWYGLLLLPLIFSHVVGWGFANFILASPLIILVSVWWMRIVRGERSRKLTTLVIAGSLFVAYTHVLAMLMICVLVAVIALGYLFGTSSAERPWGDKVRALIVPAVVMVPAVGYSLAAWFWARATSTTVWEHSWAEGQDDPAWQKLWGIAFNATGNFTNNVDQYIVWAMLMVGVVLWWSARRRGTHSQMLTLAVVFFSLYVFIPKVFIATFHIYVRFLVPAAFFVVASLPVVGQRSERASQPGNADRGGQAFGWARLDVVLASVAGLLAVGQTVEVAWQSSSIPGVADAMRVIDSTPPGRNLIGVMLSIRPRNLYREIWVHLPAVYQTRKGGLIAYSFMRNESVPVHYLPGKEPPRPPGGFEWNGRLYKVDADYARAYDLVLVHTAQTDRASQSVARQVFGPWSNGAKVLSRSGAFLLFDISELNARLREKARGDITYKRRTGSSVPSRGEMKRDRIGQHETR